MGKGTTLESNSDDKRRKMCFKFLIEKRKDMAEIECNEQLGVNESRDELSKEKVCWDEDTEKINKMKK